jgi:integrase
VDKTVESIVIELLVAKERDGLSSRYLETLRSHLNRFAAVFKDSATSIGDVTSHLIVDWLTSLKVGLRARNNIRMSVITLFHFARAQGYLPKGQSTEADDVSKAKDRRHGKIGILTPAQMAKIMKHSTAERSVYFALGGFAGLRRAEIERLEWSDFNFERAHITVGADKAKTATRRLVPIQPNLMQWLAPWRGCVGYVFGGRRRVADAIAAAVKQLGGDWPGMEWPDNGLRHSYATYRLAAIADSARVALEMGNSVQKLMTNYRELADERDAKAWFSIGPKRGKNIIQMIPQAAAV